MSNWFWLTIAIQQILGGVYCIYRKEFGWGVLLITYGLTNIMLFYLQKGGIR